MNRRFWLLLVGLLVIGLLGCGLPNSAFKEYECFWCKGKGTVQCTTCFGKGSTLSFEGSPMKSRSKPCNQCGGTGKMTCPTCKGKGKLSNNPVAK
jgi:DnaJ-class molecular chaperone